MLASYTFDGGVISARKYVALLVLVPLELVDFGLDGVSGRGPVCELPLLESQRGGHPGRLIALDLLVLEPTLVASDELDVLFSLPPQLLIIVHQLNIVLVLLHCSRLVDGDIRLI